MKCVCIERTTRLQFVYAGQKATLTPACATPLMLIVQLRLLVLQAARSGSSLCMLFYPDSAHLPCLGTCIPRCACVPDMLLRFVFGRLCVSRVFYFIVISRHRGGVCFPDSKEALSTHNFHLNKFQTDRSIIWTISHVLFRKMF